MFVIPNFVDYVSSHLLSIHELGTLLDEEMSEDERLELEDAEDVCRRFLACDLEASRGGADGFVKHLLVQILGKHDTEIEEV